MEVGGAGPGVEQAHQPPSAASAEQPSGQGIKPESAAPIVVTVDGAVASGGAAGPPASHVPVSAGVTNAIEAGKAEGRRGKRQQCGSACAVCAKSKAACDPERPCKRCVRQNKVEQCLASSAPGAGGQAAPVAVPPGGEGVKADGAPGGGGGIPEGGDKKKRRQIGKGKACQMCTKAKAACDDMRPCSRCQRLGHSCEAKPATMTSPRQIVPTHPSTAVVSGGAQGPVSVVALPLQQLAGQAGMGQQHQVMLSPQMLQQHVYIVQGMQPQQQPHLVQQAPPQPKQPGAQPSQAAPAEAQAAAAGEAVAAPARKDDAGQEPPAPALGSSQASGGVVRSAAERIFENTAAERIFDNTAAYTLVNGGKAKAAQDPPPQQPPAAPST